MQSHEKGIRGVAREGRTGDPGALRKPTSESSSQKVLAGLIERVTFHNAENGFCVLRTKARSHRDLVTVVGHAASISAGEWITASGEWINDRAQGQQFQRLFPKTSTPSSIDGIDKYLGSGMILDIGSVYARVASDHWSGRQSRKQVRTGERSRTAELVKRLISCDQ